MTDIFNFKQFSVNQAGCAMRVNTDGVLLGALALQRDAEQILDIGTGTGVIALMLAQRFPNAKVNAVEIDEAAVLTAGENFSASPFVERLREHHSSFQHHFTVNSASKYDLIVSNPPFYIRSLQSPGAAKSLAKHADEAFFEELIAHCSAHLTTEGSIWLILPPETAELVKLLAEKMYLHLTQVINIQSFAHSTPHRQILTFKSQQTVIQNQRLILYSEPKLHTDAYKGILKDFLTIF
ncbi:methyltransferase [Mucilaginibacter sp. PAMB04168]|uniref:tRNA1(Val) (adenine(37)-N6)-methyltransferase n=1 Tax=Mucilaginibacter sp. PAMB04168 TaxID=3138567 RepID=UPI0031F6917C